MLGFFLLALCPPPLGATSGRGPDAIVMASGLSLGLVATFARTWLLSTSKLLLAATILICSFRAAQMAIRIKIN